MPKVLAADFYKLARSKAFWICSAVGVAISILMVVAMKAMINHALSGGAGTRGYQEGQAMAQSASAVWAITQFLPQNFIIVLAGVFAAIFITAEFGYGTMKNTLSRGAERLHVFASKFLISTLAALVMFALSLLALVIAGSIAWGFDPQGAVSAGGFAAMIGLQALLLVGFVALFTFLGMTIRSTGGAIATNIIAVMMVSTLLSALNALFSATLDFSSYWLGGAVSTLATTSLVTRDVVRGIIVALVWGVVSLVAGGWLFRRQDVK